MEKVTFVGGAEPYWTSALIQLPPVQTIKADLWQDEQDLPVRRVLDVYFAHVSVSNSETDFRQSVGYIGSLCRRKKKHNGTWNA